MSRTDEQEQALAALIAEHSTHEEEREFRNAEREARLRTREDWSERFRSGRLTDEEKQHAREVLGIEHFPADTSNEQR